MDQDIDVSELMAIVTHELNNPLAGVIGFSQLATRTSDPQKGAELLELIEQQAQACSAVVSRIESCFVFPALVREQVDIIDLIDAAVAFRAETLAENDVAVSTEVHGGPLVVDVGATLVRQALIHLIDNAIEAMADNVGDKVLRVEATAQPDRVELAVTDCGSGVAPEHLQDIFQPTFSTRKKGKCLGLGLYAVQRIAALHGGTAIIQPALDRGTRATFTLAIHG